MIPVECGPCTEDQLFEIILIMQKNLIDCEYDKDVLIKTVDEANK